MKKLTLGITAVFAVLVVAAAAFAFGRGPMNGDVRDAIDTGDYQAYTQAMANRTNKTMLTQAQFDAIVAHHAAEAPVTEAMDRAHQAMEDDDYDAWKESMTEVYRLKTEQLTKENFDAMQDMPPRGHKRW
jgi:predicted helicase